MNRRRDYAEPIRPGVNCRHCGHELEAVADLVDTPGGTGPEVRLDWTVRYVWRHVRTQRQTCTVTHQAAASDARMAFLRMEAALDANAAQEAAWRAATGNG